MRTRFIASIIATSKSCDTPMPWVIAKQASLKSAPPAKPASLKKVARLS